MVVGLSGGNLGQILRAGVIAGATAFAFDQIGGLTYGEAHASPAFDSPNFNPANYAANVAGHALVGCASSAASGSSCQSGALSGAVGSALAPVTNSLFPHARTDLGERIGGTIVEATAGGLASVAGGGKFANGAITAAFGYLFNDVALACRGVTGTLGAGTHCGLFVFDPVKGSIQGQFSLGNNDTKFNMTEQTSQNDLVALWSGKEVYISNPPAGMSQADYDSAVMQQAQSYQTSSYNLYYGPNSNSAAAFPIIMTGGSLPTVAPGLNGWGYGARALDYWITHPPFP